ncbi:MAG TPA: glycosyltransferase family 4 protein [Candidatus Acidoferrales bacterium]
MSQPNRKIRLAIVSPFIDKRHGTERRVAEWIGQLCDTYEIHIYSQDVQDVDLSRVTWHRIPKLPGPHLFNFVWWLAANSTLRMWHARRPELRPDLVFSPGINCFDADAISVHIVFAEYVAQARNELSFSRNSLSAWPRLLHRKLYYALIMAIERRVYHNPRTSLILIAKRTALALERFYGPHPNLPVVYGGLDHATFNPQRRALLREAARRTLALTPDRFALVIVSNDGRNKGLPVLFEAMAALRNLPLNLLVVTREDPAPYRAQIHRLNLDNQIHFLPPRSDIDFYYAAADAYAGPSLEDTFAQPPAESMACGLPVIVSAANGTSEIITDGHDGLILQDPTDGPSLAEMIQRLVIDRDFANQLGRNAHQTAQQFTWERNGRELHEIFQNLAAQKSRNAAHAVTQES